MKLIDQSVELITEPDILKQIEIAGRTSYKSENKITEDSAKKFVDMLKRNNHGAALEFGTIYLKVPDGLNNEGLQDILFNPHVKARYNPEDDCMYVTTNYRVIWENHYEYLLDYLCVPTDLHHKRYFFKIITNRGVSHELVRHRTMSFLQESSRYCNYSKDKFDNNVTIIRPSWLSEIPLGYAYYQDGIGVRTGASLFPEDEASLGYIRDFNNKQCYTWLNQMLSSENAYFELLKLGQKPEQARGVLPTDLKTEICMCGFLDDWKHFLSLRSPKYSDKGKHAHPQMREVADMIYDKLNILSTIRDI